MDYFHGNTPFVLNSLADYSSIIDYLCTDLSDYKKDKARPNKITKRTRYPIAWAFQWFFYDEHTKRI